MADPGPSTSILPRTLALKESASVRAEDGQVRDAVAYTPKFMGSNRSPELRARIKDRQRQRAGLLLQNVNLQGRLSTLSKSEN